MIWAFMSGVALAVLGIGGVAVLMVVPPRPNVAEAIGLGVLGAVPFFYGLASAVLAITSKVDVGCLHLRRGGPMC